MADIKQATKWMKEGKLVRRPWLAEHISLGIPLGHFGPDWIMVYDEGKRARDKRAASFDANDLLADDWEVAD